MHMSATPIPVSHQSPFSRPDNGNRINIPPSSSPSLPTPISLYTGAGALTMYSPMSSRSTNSSSVGCMKMSCSISRLSGRMEGAAWFWRRAGCCCGCGCCCWAVWAAKMLRRVVGGRRIARLSMVGWLYGDMRLSRCFVWRGVGRDIE